MLIWDTCSMTDPLPRVCVTASTRRPLRSKRNPQTATNPAAKKRTLIKRVVAENPRLACCNVGLGRPLIPTAFVANLFRSARVSRPLPEPAFEVPGSSRAWLGGPTDARENLKKLRRQLGLHNN